MTVSVHSAQMTEFDVEELTTTESLQRLYPEWFHLWQRAEQSTPFQSPDWLIPWWKYIGEGKLRTLAIRRGAELVAVIPLYIYANPQTCARELFPVGIATTDYLDAIVDRRFASAAGAQIFEFLDTIRHEWDLCDLRQLPSRSVLLHASTPAHWRDEIIEDEPCPVLSLPTSDAELAG